MVLNCNRLIFRIIVIYMNIKEKGKNIILFLKGKGNNLII
jgi:hypothetical protein